MVKVTCVTARKATSEGQILTVFLPPGAVGLRER